MPSEVMCSPVSCDPLFSSPLASEKRIPPPLPLNVAGTPSTEHRKCSPGSVSSGVDICRICHCEDSRSTLISPCYCSGSLRYVHQDCLQQWIKSADIKNCELCKFTFLMQTKTKPFFQWQTLDLSSLERRKILCAVAFHLIAISCVIWSLYVLMQRTLAQISTDALQWSFWTKLVVLAIGFTGGFVFMYVQCKMYIHLCRRWRAYNRVIYVQHVPEKSLPSDHAQTESCNRDRDGERRRSSDSSVARGGDCESPPPWMMIGRLKGESVGPHWEPPSTVIRTEETVDESRPMLSPPQTEEGLERLCTVNSDVNVCISLDKTEDGTKEASLLLPCPLQLKGGNKTGQSKLSALPRVTAVWDRSERLERVNRNSLLFPE
ncbi:unnamed protein product [Cyprideis torosa]|uniref:Uncharacterized protein n=1 Tax=Cyprideis torosa TaxID=163714 RepID=A0A7R8W8N8_9CRUS|nr:unnamed protein product [Cyprideis torosa]CAG0888770.1 unnamed protein product [Cyprideis torosa]